MSSSSPLPTNCITMASSSSPWASGPCAGSNPGDANGERVTGRPLKPRSLSRPELSSTLAETVVPELAKEAEPTASPSNDMGATAAAAAGPPPGPNEGVAVAASMAVNIGEATAEMGDGEGLLGAARAEPGRAGTATSESRSRSLPVARCLKKKIQKNTPQTHKAKINPHTLAPRILWIKKHEWFVLVAVS
jgi:hypothetical protein